MKYIVLLGDGMADFPLEQLVGQTPLEAAKTPAMDSLASMGILGQFCPIPDDLPPGSDVGNLSVFGYNPHEHFTGRAPIEAVNQGIALGADQVCFRCNFVTLTDDRMTSFTAGHMSNEDGAQLIAALNEALADEPVTFHPGVGYRNLCIVTVGDQVAALAHVVCEPPHNITDQVVTPYLPHGAAEALPRRLMRRSREILANHPVNRARHARGEHPATQIWLWGQGLAPSLATYKERFNIAGSVVSAVDLVNGIGRCAGFEVLRVQGATGYLDTNYAGKVRAALDSLERVDFTYLHVEAPDETSHEGRTDLKIQAIEDFDRRVVAPCIEYLDRVGDVRILVAPDHVTAISTKTHAGGPVPFALAGRNVDQTGSTCYTEAAAAKSGILVAAGHRLVPAMIQQPRIDAATLNALGS